MLLLLRGLGGLDNQGTDGAPDPTPGLPYSVITSGSSLPPIDVYIPGVDQAAAATPRTLIDHDSPDLARQWCLSSCKP